MTQPEHETLVTFASEADFDRAVLQEELPVFVDVSAPWCPPCRVAEGVVRDLARRHAGKLKVVAIDGSAYPELAARLDVRGFPTFLGFVRGHMVERKLGFAGPRPLEELVQTLLRSAGEASAGAASAG